MLKRIVFSIIFCAILFNSFRVSANAATHVHAYSFMDAVCYSSQIQSTHPYYSNGIYKTCNIVSYCYKDKYVCACGSTQYKNYYTVERHTALCGQ